MLKFCLHPKELNNWKARVTERVATTYIKNNLIPSLKERDGWTDIFIGDLTVPYLNLQSPKNIISEINKNFLCKSVFPNSQMFDNCLKLVRVLEVATDGIIFKTKRTNETVTKQKALSQINMDYNMHTPTGIPVNHIEKEELPDRIPLVNGEIEIVEIKTGKSNIPPHQKKNYREAIENGFFLRYIHVDIVSFNENHFEIKEKLITNPKEVTSFPLGSS